jgi:hypothetical protein
MRRLLLLALVSALAVGGVASGSQVVTYESVTVGATAVGLAATTLDPTGRGQMTHCTGRLETAQIRFRYDGTDPTASEGTPLEVGDVLEIDSHEDAARLKMIRTGGTSGVLKVHCDQRVERR